MSQILLLESIHPGAKGALEALGCDVRLETSALQTKELISKLGQAQALGIRSKTHLGSEFFESAKDLQVVGAFCIGTNQIDLAAATKFGVPVFNAPYSNTRSVAELVISHMISLSRRVFEVSLLAHQGVWNKSAIGAHEVRGKTLGIVGYGHIGSQLSILAEALGLRVVFYDVIKKLPLGNATPIDSLDDLLACSDFVSLHVPETPQTKYMIGEKEFAQMKDGAMMINASRGTVVEIESLANALKSKKVGGAAIDVFPLEPKSNKERFSSPLQELPNVILTPHIGGSTQEAQAAIGLEVAESLGRYLFQGSTMGAVNFPNLDLPPHRDAHRLINIHQNVPGVLKKINSLVADSGANIRAQYLSTEQSIGYLALDIEGEFSSGLSKEIQNLTESLKTRVIRGES